MKRFIQVIQILVGVLFIVSGLVKANDPLGLSYKMQEFFELWNTELAGGGFFLKSALISLFQYLHAHSLALSVLMIALEILAGVALLLGWKRNFILWLLLVLMVFFTFLTGYAYLSGKFTNCGCFGDCLPITPLTSFVKDLVLLAMIVVMLAGRRHIVPLFTARTRTLALAGAALLAFGLQFYVLRYLPLTDCLPFKRGNNIAEQMKPPPGSKPDSFAIRFIYEKGGKRYEFAPENLPADFTTYQYIDRKDQLIRKGNADPPIKGFSLSGVTGEDSTPVVLNQPLAVLVFALRFSDQGWLEDFRGVVEKARSQNIPVYLASYSLKEALAALEKEGIRGVQCFNTDFTVVRTAARTDPTLYILKKGTVVSKYSHSNMRKLGEDLSRQL